jgi:hypothetical protein
VTLIPDLSGFSPVSLVVRVEHLVVELLANSLRSSVSGKERGIT